MSSSDAFRAEPGALRDHFWEKYSWTKPVDETATCWWVANAAEVDKTQIVKLKCRSVACLRLELQTVRVATVSKLKKEWERRESDNETAVQRIRQNATIQYTNLMMPIFNARDIHATCAEAIARDPDPETENPENRFVPLFKSLIYIINSPQLHAYSARSSETYAEVYYRITKSIFTPIAAQWWVAPPAD